MVEVTLGSLTRLPPATVVGLYLRSDWGTSVTPGVAPPGTALTTVVATDTAIRFAGLTPGTKYVAGASVIRTGTGYDRDVLIEAAYAVESTPGSGKWAANLTADGSHALEAGAILAAAAIDPEDFT